MKNKLFENVDIKSLITIVALILWVGATAYGFWIGQFDNVFAFFKEVFMMIISFYLGTKTKTEKTEVTEVTDNGDVGV